MNSFYSKRVSRKPFLSAAIIVVLILSTIGCREEIRPAKVPLDTLWYRHDAGGTHKRLFVLLPGRDSRHEDFEKNGFIKAVNDRGLDVDLVAVDAHLGYYMNHSVVKRLKQDVIDPAIADGYKEIWLVGISMGSMASVYYMQDHSSDISGLLLLGPYLGEKELLNEIENAGGLQQWKPGGVAHNDWQRELWQYLQAYVARGAVPPVYVAYGTGDPYAGGAEILASELPQKQILTASGGHTWGTWKPLWQAFLDRIASQVPIPVIAVGKKHVMHRHHSFEDIDRWVALFENPERHAWQKPDEVVKALALKPGDVVADIGAGTGYFTRLFARETAPGGTALGLDTEPAMVKYMQEDARKRNLDNYIARLVKADDPELGTNTVDMIFICDTLHHIDNRVSYLKRLAKALRQGGRIVIIDFYKRDLPVGPPPHLKLRKDDVINEFKDAGYALLRSHDFLPYQYFLEFGL
jgi:arsenite methyltransferase